MAKINGHITEINHMKTLPLIAGVFASILSFQAFATDDLNRTIVAIGAQDTTSAYVQLKEGTSAPCLFGLVFLGDLNQPVRKAMLALLMSAQARGAIVADVAYEMEASGFCTATKIQIQ